MTDAVAMLPESLPVRSRPRLGLSVQSVWIILTAVLFLTAHGGLYRFGPATGLVWIGATVLCLTGFLRRPGLLAQLLTQHWAVLLLPVFAILSTVWSASPAVTLLDGVQMLFTVVISIRIVMLLSTRQVMVALMLAMGGATGLSVLNLVSGALPPVFEVNGAFLGIFTQKNNAGKGFFWGAFAVMALCLIHRRPMIGLAFVAATFPLTLMTLSKTGQVGYGFILLLLVLAGLRRLSIGSRIMLPLLLVTTMGAVAGIYALTGGDLLVDALALMGKSSTLTGRTVIWALGIEVWQDNPLVGIGLNAFWSSPAYAEQVAFISANVDDGLQGFHNAYVEVLVALGVLGAAWLIGLIGVAWVRLLHLYLRSRSVEVAIWLAVLTALAVFGMFEDSFFKPRSGHLMLAVMAVAYARRALWDRG